MKIVLKADVQGSVEAIANALTKLSTTEVGVNVISSGVGGITESDVSLAKASAAVVIGFNVRPAGKAQQMAEQEGVDIKLYQVIYDAIDDVKKAMVGMLAPSLAREAHRAGRGPADLHHPQGRHHRGLRSSPRARSPASRSSAWCATRWSSTRARSGRCGASRTTPARSPQGYECGMSIEGYNDIREGDIIEAFEIESIAATLEAPNGRRGARCASAELGASELVTHDHARIARITLFFAGSHSLKEKRTVIAAA